MSKTNVMLIIYGKPSTCALGLAVDDTYVNSFIMDEGSSRKKRLPDKIYFKPLD